MKERRFRRAGARIASLSLASVLLLTACSGGVAPPGGSGSATTGKAEPAAPARASGADVFRGVVFGSGPVGTRLSMWSPESRAQAASAPREVQLAKIDTAIETLKAGGWSPDVVAKAQAAADAMRKGADAPDVNAEMQKLQEDVVLARIGEQDPTFFDRFAADMQSGDLVRVDAAYGEAMAQLKTFVNGPAMNEPRASVVPPNYYTPQHSSSTGGTSVAGPVAIAVAIAYVVVLFWMIGLPVQETDRLGHDRLIVKLATELQEG